LGLQAKRVSEAQRVRKCPIVTVHSENSRSYGDVEFRILKTNLLKETSAAGLQWQRSGGSRLEGSLGK
jgi:hypothetical protein